jgi:Vitamin K-dependent gamma-carboxylase
MAITLQRLKEFLLPTVSDRWVTFLRFGLGVEVTLYCLSLRRDWLKFFQSNGKGVISRDLSEAILSVQSPLVPRLGWLVQIGGESRVSEDTVLTTIWLLLLCAGCFLLIGFFCRSAAVSAWFLYLCAIKSGNLMTYGMDNFTIIGLFYLMLAPLPDRCALDYRRGKRLNKDQHLLGLFQRILQLHVCLIYFFSGLAKSIGLGWWNGTSIWRSLTSPPYNIIPLHVLATFAPVLPLLGIGICVLEIGFPLFIWMKRTRRTWFFAILIMHIGIAFAMGLYLFSLIMIVLNVAAFGPELMSLRETSFADRADLDLAVPAH